MFHGSKSTGTNHPDMTDLSAIPVPSGSEQKFNNIFKLQIIGGTKKCQKIHKGHFFDEIGRNEW
jgi:hypothetical protein